MMSSTLVILLSMTMMAILSGETSALPTVCNHLLSEDIPPGVRKLCLTLAKIYGSDGEINELIDGYRVLQMMPKSDSHTSTKRQDVDHVFLRFGKRR